MICFNFAFATIDIIISIFVCRDYRINIYWAASFQLL